MCEYRNNTEVTEHNIKLIERAERVWHTSLYLSPSDDVFRICFLNGSKEFCKTFRVYITTLQNAIVFETVCDHPKIGAEVKMRREMCIRDSKGTDSMERF